MKHFLVVWIFLCTFALQANEYSEIIEVLKYVETENKPHLIGDNGESWGVLQIQKACVDDVNRYFNTDYSHDDMFDISCAEEVAKLYMQMGAELYEKKYGVPPTEEVLVRNHNGGIYRGYRIKATKKYYNEYLKWKSILIKNEVNVINTEQDCQVAITERESPWSFQNHSFRTVNYQPRNCF